MPGYEAAGLFVCAQWPTQPMIFCVYMKLIIVRGVEHLLGEGLWNPLQRGRKGHPTLYKLLLCFLFQSVQPFWVCKMGSFFNLHWWITQTPKAQATRGIGNMLPQKILKSWCSETSFLMFWEDKLCLKCSVFMLFSCSRFAYNYSNLRSALLLHLKLSQAHARIPKG